MVHENFKALATRLINEHGDDVVYTEVTKGNPVDPDKPWEGSAETPTSHNVKMVFTIDRLEDREFIHFMRNTEMVSGQVDALMAVEDFEPKQGDYMTRDGQSWVIANANPLKPGPLLIMWFIEFKK